MWASYLCFSLCLVFAAVVFALVSELPRARWAIVAVLVKWPKHAQDSGVHTSFMHP